jgi:hypothetical protein
MSYANPKGVNYNTKMKAMASSIANFQNAMTSSIETFTKKKQAQQAEADKKILRDEKAYGKFNEDFLAAKQVASTLASGVKDEKDRNSLQSQIDGQLSFIGDNLKSTLDGLGPEASNQQVLNATNNAILKMRQLKGDMGHLLTAYNDYKAAIQYGAEEGGALVLGDSKNAGLINMFASWEDGKQNVVISSQPGDANFQISLLSDEVKTDSQGKPIASTGQYGTEGDYDFKIEDSFNLSDWSTKVAKSGEYFELVPENALIQNEIMDSAKDLEQLVQDGTIGKPMPDTDPRYITSTGGKKQMVLDQGLLDQFIQQGKLPKGTPPQYDNSGSIIPGTGYDGRYKTLTNLLGPEEFAGTFQSFNNVKDKVIQVPKIDPLTGQPEMDASGKPIMQAGSEKELNYSEEDYRNQALSQIVAQYQIL